MIVVDTQVLVYATLGGPFRERAERAAAVDPDWHAPVLWRSEYMNVLAGEIRRGSISVDQADALAAMANALVTSRSSERRAVLELVPTSSCTAYDLEYVAVARALGAPLVTNDAQILSDFPGIAVSLDSFAAGSA